VKKRLASRILLSAILITFSLITFAQESIIKGKILDANSLEPLFGASVRIEGTTIGAASDPDGNYTVKNVPDGDHNVIASYVSYIPSKLPVKGLGRNKVVVIDMLLNPADMNLAEFEIVSRSNRESESILLVEQKQALVAGQLLGAKEMSRKGIGDARAAVSKVSEISRQEGVKNVFVRGLGDRYNITLLNGFPVPSEDPEYKNISLDFFKSDIIQNIAVSKVFAAGDYSDVGGAVINIASKELFDDQVLQFEVSAGLNTYTAGRKFLVQDGSDYFGYANNNRPTGTEYNFANSLDPQTVSLPLNHSYGLSVGKFYRLKEPKNTLSFFLTASHSTDNSYREEIVRNTTSTGIIWQDQRGKKFSQSVNQLILGNAGLGLNKHKINYNFMMIHANEQYLGEYEGYNSERYQDSPDYMGILRRQQANDNLLIVNQVLSKWKLTPALTYNAAVSYSNIKGLEPDRRENYFSLKSESSFDLTRSNRNKRFFSELGTNDLNLRTSFEYRINNSKNNHSEVRIGYVARFLKDRFEALEYNFNPLGMESFTMQDLSIDELFEKNISEGRLIMDVGQQNTYSVTKNIHSGYAEFSHQLTRRLSGNIGVRLDLVDMTVDYNVQHVQPGDETSRRNFILPSLNLKYDVNNKNSIRLGASKTYTLPHSKEVSPYQYVNISFVSQGNPNIRSSENYNLDLRWDYYLSSGELLVVSGFYKYITDPIGRVDQGNSAGLLTYDNISDHAQVAGTSLEFRKYVFSNMDTQANKLSRLTLGLNASYIYTNLDLRIPNTTARKSQLEGASPFIANVDLSYNYQKSEKSLTTSVIFNYYSDRIHTIGAKGFNNIIEKGIPTLDFASSFSINKNICFKAKVSNILNSGYKLTRKSNLPVNSNDSDKGNVPGENEVVLNEYQSGQGISIGISYTIK
jgi:hypothetical protein